MADADADAGGGFCGVLRMPAVEMALFPDVG